MEHVAVVVPCYNAAAHVGSALAAVLAQTCPPVEIVVVDDGSRDSSRDVVAGIAGVRLLAQPNRGAAAARNAGIAATTAPLLAFLDADDIWSPDSLAQRLAVLAAGDADLVYGQIQQCIGEAGPDAPRLGPAQPGRLAGSLLIRRAVFDRVGGFDESLATAETVDWVARAAALGIRSAACDAVVLYRRIHGANLMLRAPAPDRDALAVLRRAVGRRRNGAV